MKSGSHPSCLATECWPTHPFEVLAHPVRPLLLLTPSELELELVVQAVALALELEPEVGPRPRQQSRLAMMTLLLLLLPSFDPCHRLYLCTTHAVLPPMPGQMGLWPPRRKQ